MTAFAQDPENDLLIYKWSASEGTFLDPVSSSKIRWQSPVSEFYIRYKIKLVVSDGGKETSQIIAINVEEYRTGEISGYIYYFGTKIPIQDAVVILGDRSYNTGKNGYYVFMHIPKGKYILKAWKSGFNTISKEMTIDNRVKNEENFEMTSDQYTIEVTGYVTNENTGLPLSGYEVIVLNPDDTFSEIRSMIDSDGYYELFYVPSHMDVPIGIVKDNEVVYNSKIIYSRTDKQQDFLVSMEFEFTDPRDGNIYRANKIGNQVWMLENLAYLPQVNTSSKGSVNEPYYYVYGNESTNVEEARDHKNYSKYGVLYNYPAALTACPDGWHLPPDDNMWVNPDEVGWIGSWSDNNAKNYKSRTGWFQDGNGEDTYGFNALPAGFRSRYRGFEDLTKYTYFWTADSFDDKRAWSRALGYYQWGIERYMSDKNNGFSVRCVMYDVE